MFLGFAIFIVKCRFFAKKYNSIQNQPMNCFWGIINTFAHMSIDKIKKRLIDQSIKDDEWLVEAKERQDNEAWLNVSAAIALRILGWLRKNKMTQKELSQQLGYSPQYVNTIVKGSENLTLETIVKIEKVLGIKLIEVPSFEAIADSLAFDNQLIEEGSF
jgi:ribosome-binding protein aMBF1 (putative translation factor)